jgi:anti-anti-sigma factor
VDNPTLRIMERRRASGAVVLTVQGEVDVATVGVLAERLGDACEPDGAVTVDLRRVSFMDCLGLRVLLDLHERGIARRCRVEFVQGPAPVRRLFEITGTLDTLAFVDAGTRKDAAAAST